MALVFAPEYGCKFTLTGPDGTKAVFNDSTDGNFVGVLDPNECSGLDSPNVREDAEDASEEDGSIQGSNYYGPRSIVLGGAVIASTVQQRNERLQKIKRACNAMRADATLSWSPTGMEGTLVTVKVRRQQPLRVTKGYVKAFQIALVSALAPIFGPEQTKSRAENGEKTSSKPAGEGATSGGGTAWTSPGNIKVSDSTYATVAIATPTNSQNLIASSFGLTLPSDAQIIKVELEVKRKSSVAATIKDLELKLRVGGVAVGENRASAENWPTGEATKTYVLYERGGVNASQALTPALANTANFGAQLSVQNPGALSTASVDFVQVKVTYERAVEVNNQGDTEVPGLITVEGPVSPTTSIEVWNRTLGNEILFSGAGILGAGKIATIDLRAHNAIINGAGGYGKLNFEVTNWFMIQPGVNLITANNTGALSVAWSDGWL